MPGQQLPAKAGIAITGDGDVDLTKVTADGLGRMAVAGLVADAAVAGVAQMLGHFGIQCRFKDGLGALLQHAVLADQVSGLLVMGHDVIEQGLREGGTLCRFLRGVVRCGAIV